MFIAYPTRVKIFNFLERELLIGAQVRLLAELYAESEIFTTYLCPVTYEWSSTLQGANFEDIAHVGFSDHYVDKIREVARQLQVTRFPE